MVDIVETPKKRTTARKPKPKVQANQFQPYAPAAGEKDMASPEDQERFNTLFKALAPEVQEGVVWLVQQLTTDPFLKQGYRKMLRFLRNYVKDRAKIGF